MSVATAILALHGATGANAETLAQRVYFKNNETSGTVITDYAANSPVNGTLIGSPTLAVTGPAETESPNRAITFATGSGISRATADTILADLSGLGVCVMAFLRHSSTASGDLLAVLTDNATGLKGFKLGLNLDNSGAANTPYAGAVFTDDFYATKTFGGHVNKTSIIYDDEWHLWCFYIKQHATTPIVRIYCDGILQAVVTATGIGGKPGTFTSAASRLGISCFPYLGTDYTDAAYAFAGDIAHVTVLAGEPTVVQQRNILLAAWDSFQGIPGAILRTSALAAYADAARTTPSSVAGVIRSLADLSGHAAHLSEEASNSVHVPTYETTINAGVPAICLDNFYSNYDTWNPLGVTVVQQALSRGTMPVKLFRRHSGMLWSGRMGPTTVGGKTNQSPVSLRLADNTLTGSLAIANDEPVILQGGSAKAATAIPKWRTAPGFSVAGWSSGGAGNPFNTSAKSTRYDPADNAGADAFIAMNRWRSSLASNAFTGGTPETDVITKVDLGGVVNFGAGGGAGMCGCMTEDLVIFRCPFTEEEYDAAVAAMFTAKGELLIPTHHVVQGGTSVPSGTHSSKLRTMFNDYPAHARRETSYTNGCRGSYRLDYSDHDYSAVYQGFDDLKWWEPSSNIPFSSQVFQAEWMVNDCTDGDSQGTFDTDISSFLSALPTTGGDIPVVVWNLLPALVGTGQTVLNPGPNNAVYARTIPGGGSGDIADFVTLTSLGASGYVDGVHITPAAQLIWAADWNLRIGKYAYGTCAIPTYDYGGAPVSNTGISTAIMFAPGTGDGAEITHYKIIRGTGGTVYLNNGTTELADNAFATKAQVTSGLKFKPTAGFTGVASFTAKAAMSSGGIGLSAVVTVSITVVAASYGDQSRLRRMGRMGRLSRP